MKQYAYKDLIFPAVFAVVWTLVACLITLAGDTLFDVIIAFCMTVSGLFMLAVIFELACFDEYGFYVINILGKRKYEISWDSINKAERRKEYNDRSRDLKGTVYVAVYNNEHFVEPNASERFRRPWKKPHKNEAVMLISYHERALFSEWLERKRPDLFIERHESSI